jgi:hypothetical protein
MNEIGWFALVWLSVVGATLVYFRRDLRAVWSEPVLRHPVMIIESDDWGAGPVAEQAAALDRLHAMLARYRDASGRHPVMTLALVLAVPDGAAIRRDGAYRRLSLDDPRFSPVRDAIERGRAAGVFALQLHGMEHYWPANLMASSEAGVREWLRGDAPATTEALPSPLQSRWIDASVLPSRPLDPVAVEQAAIEETHLFQRLFGTLPHVVVPPTFVWTETVERAWAHAGVEFVVTPGLRSACRNAAGVPDCDSGPFYNNQAGQGVTYLVRDDYFEPERGHRAERGVAALTQKWAQRRACLFETHRSNFISDAALCSRHLAEIDRLYTQALDRYADLRFVSTEELGRAFQTGDPSLLENKTRVRLAVCLYRARDLPAFWRWARVTGLAGFMNLVAVSLKPRTVTR